MASLDTNVLVRFLVRDDASQGAAASSLIRNALRDGEALFVTVTVLREHEWLLRSAFGFDKPAVLQALFGLLGTFELTFDAEGAIETALAQYERNPADFSDCLHSALAQRANQSPLWTFDKAAAKLDGAKLLA
jgi:predicted nucleic-acid-binding protein